MISEKVTSNEQKALCSGPRKKRICLLSLSDIASDPRVRRQGDAFHSAGWKVIGIGLPGTETAQPAWSILTQPLDASSRGAIPQRWFARLREKLKKYHALRSWARRIRTVYVILRVRARAQYALDHYWSPPEIKRLYAIGCTLDADIWLANDWTMLPLAARLARERGGRYAYDTHEFAVDEYAQSAIWRLTKRPIVRIIEQQFIGGAAQISTVSGGIAERLQKTYNLPARPLVIRNTPNFHVATFRPTGVNIQLLYHGIIVPNRGLEVTIDSVALWQPQFTLTIRGPGEPKYIASLKKRIAERNIEERVRFAPPVPMTQLVQAAMPFDIGFFALPGHSFHNAYALPNKIFEYIMAGLALCVTDLPEMTSLIKSHDVGVTFSQVQPDLIAQTVNALDRDTIDRFKKNSLAAAHDISWERESKKMLDAYEGILTSLLPQG